jgi:succinate dehydrogenase/fumarate reductase cytochrome b subunit
LSFFYVKYFGSIRHHGFLFILFIMVAWMYPYAGEAKGFTRINRFSRIWGKSLSPIITLILIFHLVGGITAVRMDNRYVFSYGKATAAFIKARKMQDMLMVGETDYAVSTVVGYLEKDRVYYPRGERFGSFVIWDEARTRGVSDEQVVQKAKELGTESTQEVLLILNHALHPDLISQNSLTELAKFTGSTVGDEGFYLYLMRL